MKIRKLGKEQEKKFNYVYKLTFKYDERYFYVGKRSTNNADDSNYRGSGKLVKKYQKKYGNDCFKKEILSYWDTAEEALIEEARIVTRELVENEFCLNRIIGGGSFDTLGCKWGKRTEEQNKKNSEAHKGKKQSEETKLKRSISIKEKWKDENYRQSQKNGRNGKYKNHLNNLTEQRRGKICIIKDGKWKYIDNDKFDEYKKLGWKRRGIKDKLNYETILKYREQGLSYQKIGDKYGVGESCIRSFFKKNKSIM